MIRPTAIRRRLGLLLASHTLVDVYAAFVPPLLGVLEVRCQLDPAQTAWLLGIGSLTSGLSQPLSAWLGDRVDSRIFGGLGLAMAAVCISSIGHASSYPTLVLLYALGMIGVGVYHPIAASSMGHLSDMLGSRRSLGVSFFFVAGMAGGVTGAFLAPRIAALEGGFDLLRYAMIPGLLVACLLQLAIGRLPHRHEEHRAVVRPAAEMRARWAQVGMLYAANAMRFTVNMALFYLFVRWAQARYIATHPDWTDREIADAAAPVTGNLNALLVVGMAIGGLIAGSLTRVGRERWPMVLVPILFAPFIGLFPLASVEGGYVLAILAGIGFAAMIPVTISVSQRLLPHRTSLASGLMLGGAWTLAVAGPALAEVGIHTPALGLGGTFVLTAVLLALSGLVCLPLRTMSEASTE
jgi:FSR family fosmidomycin resistance protein-like MFS transporter